MDVMAPKFYVDSKEDLKTKVMPCKRGTVMSLTLLLSLPVDLTLITRRVLKNGKRKFENSHQIKISGFSSYNK